MNIKFIVLIIIILLLIGIFLVAYASADIATFSLTSDFDAGIKTNVETISDSCTNQLSSNQFGLSNAGNYVGIKTNCLSGTREFQNAMQASYNFQDLRNNNLRDMIANADCTIVNAPTSVFASYGNGYSFVSGSSQYMNCPNAAPTTSSWSVQIVVKPLVSGSKVLLSLDTSVSGNFFMAYGMNCNLAADVNILHVCQTNVNDANTSVSINSSHYITWVKNAANATHNLYVDGGWKAKAPSVNGGTTDINICKWVNATPDYCDAVFDEMSIWNRVLNDTEILKLSTDGRSFFVSSGNWVSAMQTQSFTSISFTSVTIIWTPAANTNIFVSGITLIDSNGNTIVTTSTLIQTGVTNTYTMVGKTFLNWKIQVNLSGNTTSTISVTSIQVNFTVDSSARLFGDIGRVFAFLMILILMLMGSYWLKTHWKSD
jgi:Concanavalin A-like lectin/glucanases superfamily